MMNETKIKICGIREPEIAMWALGAGADYIGVVFAEGSPRQVTIAQARNIVAEVSASRVEPVALFANQTRAFIDEVLDSVNFKYIQLHGDEDKAFIEAMPDVQIFKAVPFHLGKINYWKNPPANVAALLIDTPTRPDEITGGTGRAFDWDKLAELDRSGLPPIILAGGLTPTNIHRAIDKVRPFAVDVSSGVESSPGLKNPQLIYDFCIAVQSADNSIPPYPNP
jgi:phosphoribosylanthranilate isomerase